MASKRSVIVLSAASFISTVFIGGLTVTLVTLSPFSIISDSVSGMKIAIAGVVTQCLLHTLLTSLLSFNKKESKAHIQVLDVIKVLLLLVLATLAFYATAICFGAPLLSSMRETCHFAVLMTMMVCLPYCLAHISNMDNLFTEPSVEVGPETTVYITSICALLGAWLGAVPIPLDWDRPWQVWPISCAIGALGGYTIGHFVAAIYLPRKYRTICKTKFI